MINDVIAEIAEALRPLPEGFSVQEDPDHTGNILVGNAEWAFCITRKMIDDNMHVAHAKAAFPQLKECVNALAARKARAN